MTNPFALLALSAEGRVLPATGQAINDTATKRHKPKYESRTSQSLRVPQIPSNRV